MFQILPIEIQDKIFLYLDFETLTKSRIFQSTYIQSVTKYNSLKDAARYGNLECIKWLMFKGLQLETSTFLYAASNWNFETMNWLLVNNCPWSEFLFLQIVCGKNLEYMAWLKENKCPWDENLFYECIRDINEFDPKVIEWLKENKYLCNDK